MREGGQIKGLTTASTVWMVSALGMGIGGGEFGFVIVVTLIILFVLWAFPRLEAAMGRLNETRTYEVLSERDVDFFHDLEKMWKDHRLRIHFRRQAKSPKGRLTVWVVSGPPSQQDRATEWLFSIKKYSFSALTMTPIKPFDFSDEDMMKRRPLWQRTPYFGPEKRGHVRGISIFLARNPGFALPQGWRYHGWDGVAWTRWTRGL
jgi:hypothetical protein